MPSYPNGITLLGAVEEQNTTHRDGKEKVGEYTKVGGINNCVIVGN
jgi:hypothetical protein